MNNQTTILHLARASRRHSGEPSAPGSLPFGKQFCIQYLNSSIEGLDDLLARQRLSKLQTQPASSGNVCSQFERTMINRLIQAVKNSGHLDAALAGELINVVNELAKSNPRVSCARTSARSRT